jgi:adenine-specific DNA methylase
MRRAKEYSLLPQEREVKAGRTVRTVSLPGERIEGNLAKDFAELAKGSKNAFLLCGSGERLPIPDKSVDAVITDPPYSDNVQYGELSDFFYVWQRLALREAYQEFRPVLVPKDREVVKNPKHGKDGSFYEEGLRRVFSECRRVLKDDGLLVFTFHHQALEAWVNVLRAVLDAGFCVTAAYPVHSEMTRSVHIQGNRAIACDVIVACRGRREHRPARWSTIEGEIRARAHQTLEGLKRSRRAMSVLDRYVVILGTCLECYSRHFPDVRDEAGSVVLPEEAIQRAAALAETLILGNRSGGGRRLGPGARRGDAGRACASPAAPDGGLAVGLGA